LRKLVVDRLPAGVKLYAMTDSCSSGTALGKPTCLGECSYFQTVLPDLPFEAEREPEVSTRAAILKATAVDYAKNLISTSKRAVKSKLSSVGSYRLLICYVVSDGATFKDIFRGQGSSQFAQELGYDKSVIRGKAVGGSFLLEKQRFILVGKMSISYQAGKPIFGAGNGGSLVTVRWPF
jgi:hypothetical protein